MNVEDLKDFVEKSLKGIKEGSEGSDIKSDIDFECYITETPTISGNYTTNSAKINFHITLK